MNRSARTIRSIQTVTLMLMMLGVSILGCESSQESPTPDSSASDQQTEPVELAALMGDLQQYTHKLALSAHAENREATRFYLHETRALTTEIQSKVPTYEGFPIATLVDQIFVPRVDSLEAAVDRGDWNEISAGIDAVVTACNTCHTASAHGFVQITEGLDTNPYNQSFDPQQ